MKSAIRERALALGFDDCRFTTADPPATAHRFTAWLAQGYHGAMTYLTRRVERRVDPQRVLPGAKTIILLAVSYAAARVPGSLPRCPGSALSPASLTGFIARYARYRDYHLIVGEQLAAFVDALAALAPKPIRSRAYVDTGPVLERDLAQRAGLGFVGKHTNLIHRRLGNWLFLAEVFTTLELEPDSPQVNHCGRCVRCLAACPTRAILQPFVLDASRCLAYLTVEWRGPIPLDLRPALGRRVFGCDDCLAVCPWNRFAQAGRLLAPHARPALTTPDLLELLSLDEAAFRQRFRDTPLWRNKRQGLIRNVCVALGNDGDPRALPPLESVARSADPLLAEHAAWAIRQILLRRSPPRPGA